MVSGVMSSNSSNISLPIGKETHPDHPRAAESFQYGHISTSSNEGDWDDVTVSFHQAQKEMDVGEMIHQDSFNLLNAMAAIELMDPKMDIGYGEVRNVTDVALPPQLSDQQVINIMDQLLVAFMSWLDAHTLPQSIFACVYAQLLPQIPRKELCTYLRTLLATADAIINLVLDEKVADDEDFIASTYGFVVQPLSNAPPQDDGVTLRALLQEIRILNIGRSKSEKDIGKAITMRVEFFAEFYRLIQCLAGYSFEHSPYEAPSLLRGVRALAVEWSRCRFRHIVDKDLINQVFDASINRHLMTSSPPRTAPLFDAQTAFGYLQRILTEFEDLLNHESHVLPSHSPKPQPTSPDHDRHSLMVAMQSMAFSSAKLDPTVLTRSLMSRLMVPEYSSSLFSRETADFRKLVGTDMGLTNKMMNPSLLRLLTSVRHGVTQIFKCFCRNRSRQRRQVLKVIRWWDEYAFCINRDVTTPESNANIENGAEDANESSGSSSEGAINAMDITQIHPSSNSTTKVEAFFDKKNALQIMCYEIESWLMVQHWLLGFECDLYKEYEYCAIYFYVGYVLTSKANATVALARKALDGAVLHSLRFAQYSMDEARMWMCRALYLELDALSEGNIWNFSNGRPCKKLDGTGTIFGTEELWYEQRFGFAKSIVVNGPAYADYNCYLSFKKAQRESLAASNRGEHLPILLLKDAAAGFLAARRLLESAKNSAKPFNSNHVSDETLQMARSAVENSLEIPKIIAMYNQARQNEQIDLLYDVSFSFKTHPHFPVIKVIPP